MFGGRDSSETTWLCWSCSSAASSIVMIRSLSGMKLERMFRSVVLPTPVPPEMRTFSFPRTQAESTSTSSGVIEPRLTRLSAVNASTENFRIVSTGPCRATGGRITFTREPSGSRASTIGEASSTRRPTPDTIRSITRTR